MWALGYLLVAVGLAVCLYFGLRRPVRAFLKFRGAMVVTCPETAQPAGVKVDARRAAMSGGREVPDFSLTSCSRWPERQECGRQCLKQIEAAPEDCLVRSILDRWYHGKDCVFCGKPLGEINWEQRKPALLASDGRSMEWAQVLPENLPAVLAAGRAVCWTCHVTETFRRQHPELVVDRNFRQAGP